MYIPDSVLKNIEKKPTDNDYIYGAEQMYKRLSSITEETYLDIDMSMLANALEMYYKGVLDASGLNIDSYLMKTHSLNELYREISVRISPLGNETTENDKRELRHYLNDLTALYVDARYHYAQTPYEDFDKNRLFLSNQRERCMTMLDPSKSWEVSVKREKNNLPLKKYEPSGEEIE